MVNYYVGGGTLHFKKTGTATFVEIAAVSEAKVNVKAEYAEAYDHSGGTKVLAKKVPKKFEATLSFKTTDTSAKNIAMAVYGKQTSAVEVIDEVAGITAIDNVTATKISFGKELLFEGAFKFISENASGQQIILDVYNATVTPGGDVNLQSEDISELSFEGSAMLDANGNYADMYILE